MIKPRMGDIIDNHRPCEIGISTHTKPRMGDIIIEIRFAAHDQTQNG